MSEIKLNLGCRNKKLPGFINIDICEDTKPDVVDNAFTLKKFQWESVDLIYSSHMLEHLNYAESFKALSRWHFLLKKGGVLRLSVPDLEVIFAHCLYYKNLSDMMHLLYGDQSTEFEYHKMGWTFDTLKIDLECMGFEDIKRWNWRTTEPHSYIDDYSQSYWPHMSKTDGRLLSLNVECKK